MTTQELVEAFLAQAFLADLSAAFVVYFIIETRFKLRDDRAQRRSANRQILSFVHDELRNLERTDRIIERLEKHGVTYPALGVTGWSLIVQEQVFSSIPGSVLAALLRAYDLQRAANEVYEHLLATVQNPELRTLDDPAQRDSVDRYLRSVRDSLTERLAGLQEPVRAAIAALERELQPA